MKVILQADVRGQGKKGALVEVSDGYARNYLLPRKLALPATNDNINTLKLKEKSEQARIAAEKQAAADAAAKLKGATVKIAARAGAGGKLFGSITSKEIAEALKNQQNIIVEKNKIVLAENIKSFGTYEAKCKFGYEISVAFNVVVCEQ